ncbi:glycoside hydrolase family 15 protein [Streptomyces sp. NRRL S-87]|uniref:glycoside hydrolase family 15 protein n=1 Tax=Streptomyces sp. NRRL S-87 TaxID=1463920 RepID=UPI0004C14C0F|nr:glycoside hydrolase family 15 protein [Streptomyces sp. NRRL S-87]
MNDGWHGHTPYPLREYALIADGERGALIDPGGAVVWMCAPRWHSDAVFSELIGGSGGFEVCPENPWRLAGGEYVDGALIRVSRWTLNDGTVECRDALAVPADPHRAVLLRRIRAVDGPALVRVRLSARAAFGARPMTALHRDRGGWHGRIGPLRLSLWGLADAAYDEGEATLTARLPLTAGDEHDLVLEIADGPAARNRTTHQPAALQAARLWQQTEERWAAAVPDCSDLTASRDARQAYAVLTGLTAGGGAMVAAATTSLPERAGSSRAYDYRYAWIRDQCYAGSAVAAHGPHRLLDDAVRFVTARVLEDGPVLRPAYRVDGRPVPGERTLTLAGYPGASDRVGNRAGHQFQLDTFGEVLELLAAAARRDRLDADGVRAARVAVSALEANWQRPDTGIWELRPAWWTHSRLAAVSGLRAAARSIADPPSAYAWSELADSILHETRRTCLHRSGRWQRSREDPRVDASLLRPLSNGAWPASDPTLAATRSAVERELTQDGFVYRYDGTGPDDGEGAFLLCGFFMSAACLAEGRPVAAARWFERTRSAYGPPGLFAEEYDVRQRQLRGNLPQAFVHALLLENAVRLTAAGREP